MGLQKLNGELNMDFELKSFHFSLKFKSNLPEPFAVRVLKSGQLTLSA